MAEKWYKTGGLFNKGEIQINTLQKLEELESASLVLDARLSLKDATRKTGLAFSIGEKSSDAKKLFTKVNPI